MLLARLAVGYLTLPRSAQGGLNRVLRRIQRLKQRHPNEQGHTEWWFSLVYGMDLQWFSSRVLSHVRKNHSDRLEGDVGEGEVVDNQESDGGGPAWVHCLQLYVEEGSSQYDIVAREESQACSCG